jgi:hypothetical protein
MIHGAGKHELTTIVYRDIIEPLCNVLVENSFRRTTSDLLCLKHLAPTECWK